jgi:superfamily II DNA or RNA helicase
MGTDRIPCKHVYAVLQQLDERRVDLGAEGRVLQVETLDPAEAQRSLGISSERTPRAIRAGARDEGGVEEDGDEEDGVEDDGDEDDGSAAFDDDSDGVGDFGDDEDDDDDDEDDDDDGLDHRRSAARSLAVTQVVAPRHAIAARGGRGADADWRSRLGWLQRVPAPVPAPRVPSEIEIVLAQFPWIDRWGNACAVPAELTVALYGRSRKRDGTLGPRTMLDLSRDWNVSTGDRALIELLLGCTPKLLPLGYASRGFSASSVREDAGEYAYLTGATIHPSAVARVLPVLCASGRLGRAGAPKGEPADRASPETLALVRWDGETPCPAGRRPAPPGRGIALQLELVRGDETLTASRITGFASADYLIAEDRLIRVDGCDDLGRWLVAAGGEPLRLPIREIAALIETIGGRPRAPQLMLDALGWTTVPGTPAPQLYFEPIPGTMRLGGRVAFRYGELEAAAGGALVVDRESRQVIQRDRVAEAAARAQLAETEGGWIPAPPHTGHEVVIDLVHFAEAATRLQALGWELWVRGGRLRRGGRLKVQVESDTDWFDVSVEAEVEGLGAELPELLRALREGQPFVRLTDGSMGMVLPEWLAQHRRLATLGKLSDGALRVPRAAAPLLDAMLATLPDVEVEIDAAFRKLRARLASATAVEPCREPRSFRGELRPYQRDALGWFRFLGDIGLGGCLADDMGLGKTVQVLAMLAARRQARPSLVVAPKTVVFNWIDEARRFAPRLRVVDYTGPDRSLRRAAAAEADLVVTSYPILRLDAAELATWELEYAILDEAQAIKNPEARVTEAARVLRARRRLALTGTPVENHLGDLASILEFLNPGLTCASDALRALLGTRPGDAADLTPLARALRPFLLRRTKDQVLPDLPTRTEQVLRCQLGTDQRRQYDELLRHYRAALLPQVARDGMARSTMHVLEALLRLRQAACHAGLIDPRSASAASAKLDTLLDHVAEATESGHKALIFSQFTSFLALLRARLDAGGVTYEYLDGQTRDRKERVTRFQTDPACKLFLISLKAGGSGLNLTAADYVYLLDPWWNPAVEAQAIDRTHRPGQTRPVLAYRLIAENTVEDKILELQARKRQLASGIFADDGGGLAKLSVADLELLFS